MWMFGSRGEVAQPPNPKGKLQEYVPCGEWMDYDLASWHILECSECDAIQKARHFIPAGDPARKLMGYDP